MVQTEILKKYRSEIDSIVSQIKKYRPRKVILFGSFADGDINAHSDIDLCIIKNTSRRFLDRIGDVLLLIDSSFPVEPLVYTENEFKRLKSARNPLILHIAEKGKVLYEQKS